MLFTPKVGRGALRFRFLFGFLFSFLFSYSQLTAAVETTQSKPLIELADFALASHPLMQLAKARLDQAVANSKANSQPLYNPQLAFYYESNVDDIATAGVSQTFDWSDKRGALRQVGEQNLASAQAKFVDVRQTIAADLLNKINRFQSSKQIADLNTQQMGTLEEFVEIAKRRFGVGDISQIELDLALLAAGEIRMNSAKIQADNFAAKLQLEAFFNFEKLVIPELTINLIKPDAQSAESLLQNHPRLRQLRRSSGAAKNKIKLAERLARADPTISLNAGKEGDETTFNLGFSMPLFVRNNFSAQIDSAIANSVAVEQDYLNAYRDVLVAVKSTKKSLDLTLAAYHHWMNQSQAGLQQRAELLQKLWKSGDLETTDYLVQLQQTLDTRIAATQLKADVFSAWIQYLVASGQIDHWLALEKS